MSTLFDDQKPAATVKDSLTVQSTCPHCNLMHAPCEARERGAVSFVECSLKQAQAITALLKAIGEPGVCRGCYAEIVWVTHRNGKKTPYTPAGLNHFVHCPKREQFKEKA